jgi:hypothetical protein
MPHDVSLIATIAAGFGLAMVFGFIAVRLRMPPLVGYLLAGVVIGPATPGFVADVGLARQLAEIGVMLLMFGVGLHFSLGDLSAVKRIAVPGAIVQIAVATIETPPTNLGVIGAGKGIRRLSTVNIQRGDGTHHSSPQPWPATVSRLSGSGRNWTREDSSGPASGSGGGAALGQSVAYGASRLAAGRANGGSRPWRAAARPARAASVLGLSPGARR